MHSLMTGPSLSELAQRRLAGPVVQADADHLPFADGSFDVTTAVTLCEFTVSAEVTIAELARVSRPGGQLVIGVLNPRSLWGLGNRSQFGSPPWSGAKWLSEGALRQIGSRYGDVETVTVLYAPRAAPGLRWLGFLAERIGHVVAPHHGAFIVARIQRNTT